MMMTSESYLWDRSAPRDAFVTRLERLLTPQRKRVRMAGWPRGSRILRVVGAVSMAAVATVVVWLCFGSGNGEAKTSGTDEVAPPMVVDTTPPAAKAPDAAHEAAADARTAGHAVGDPAPEVTAPGACATTR